MQRSWVWIPPEWMPVDFFFHRARESIEHTVLNTHRCKGETKLNNHKQWTCGYNHVLNLIVGVLALKRAGVVSTFRAVYSSKWSMYQLVSLPNPIRNLHISPCCFITAHSCQLDGQQGISSQTNPSSPFHLAQGGIPLWQVHLDRAMSWLFQASVNCLILADDSVPLSDAGPFPLRFKVCSSTNFSRMF